jgi:DNA-binding response OmpR family regulator
MILIVDDDFDFVESVKIVLEDSGYQVISAGNPEEGMKLVQQENPDLVILDIIMVQPDDGIVMAQDIRKSGYAKPIIMLSSISKVTGFTFRTDDQLIPADDFLEKPVEPEVLLEKVKTLLEKAGENSK